MKSKAKSESKDVIFYFTQRGLCSELIGLIYTLAYTKVNSLKVTVDDKFWNSCYEHGWYDYFEASSLIKIQKDRKPCYSSISYIRNFPSIKSFLQYLYIIHSIKTKNLAEEKKGLLKYLIPVWDFIRFTLFSGSSSIELFGTLLEKYNISQSKLWLQIQDFSQENKEILIENQKEIPLHQLLSNIAQDIWIPKNSIKKQLDKKLNLVPNSYVSVHIRRGDKLIREAKATSVDSFIEIIEDKKWCNFPIIVSSDDFTVLEEFNQKKPNWHLFSLTKSENKGHDQDKFNSLNKKDVYNETMTFINELDIHVQSKFYLGSISSNVSKLISLIRNDKKKTFTVDKTDSEIYNNFVSQAK